METNAPERSLDDKAFAYFKTEVLEPKERIVWTGRPSPRTAARQGVWLSLVGAAAAGFAVYWILGSGGPSDGFWIATVPMLLAGMWMLITPLRYSGRARRAFYAVTDKRIVIIEAGVRMHSVSIGPDELSDAQRVEHADGTGSIQLIPNQSADPSQGLAYRPRFINGFWGVTDIDGAEAAIEQLRENATWLRRTAAR